MWAQAGIISADHQRERRETKKRAVRCTPNVTLNPVRHCQSCQWGSRIQMEMLQHQRFSEILHCGGPLAGLLNKLPSHSLLCKKKTIIGFFSLFLESSAEFRPTRNECRQGRVDALALYEREDEDCWTGRDETLVHCNEAWNQTKLRLTKQR